MHYIRIASHVFPILLSTANALTKLERENSANNFQRSFRGWTSFPLQAYNHPQHQEYGDDWFNEQHLREQADALSNKVGNGYEYFMLDSGWSADESDENGRIMPNSQRFADFKKFSEDIHAMGLKLGVYIVPGAFTKDILQDKAIANSDLKMGAINTACNITNGDPFPCAFGRTNLQYNQASREWVNSVVKQFADEWYVYETKTLILADSRKGKSISSSSITFTQSSMLKRLTVTIRIRTSEQLTAIFRMTIRTTVSADR